ncbi:hypothetical protein HN784_02855 [bacterium]|jgi:hypothetical protein|nr:hypothetical protein [bacterium]MBT4597790.1 hypothetical protein [bacterium]MBT6753371.1 hypothetical protein [bacterium]MBT7037221.1 hypothetical protein [bacterium]MBT7431754.1 hypothetical protein [bacterium]
MKKNLYLVLVILLVFLLGFIGYMLIESVYLKHLISIGVMPKGSYTVGAWWQAFPLWIKTFIIFAGIADGYFLGQFWWRVVYIEKRHWRNRKKKS